MATIPTAAPPRRARWWTDLAVGLGVAATWLVAVTAARRWDYWHPVWFESYWLAGIWLALPLALRRTAPGVAFWVTAAAYPVIYTRWVPANLQSPFHVLPLLVAAFLVTRSGVLTPWLVGAAAAAGTLWLAWGSLEPLVTWLRDGAYVAGGDVNEMLLLLALVAAATVLGAVLGRLDETLASLAERNRQLEALQEVRTREAVQSERVRIARDLHDVVAHHVSAIVVRAQAVERVGGDDVTVYRDAVRWIGPAGREALDAMRSMVRVLRADAAPLAPAATLADVVGVVDRMRGAGLQVEADLPSTWPPCAPAVGLAVVRVTQEALTNVVSHSLAHRARVCLGRHGGRLVLEVLDPGPARTAPAARANGRGNGLVNMRERAAACGGSLEAGPVPDGGWRVRLEVPFDE